MQVESVRWAWWEEYRYTVPGHGMLVWHITRAKEQVAAGHVVACVEMSREEMANTIARCEWDESHLLEVDITLPGIAAPFIWDGRIIYVPIDGIHRLVRAYREGKPFYFQLLTDAASRACLIEGPRELIP